MNIELIRKLQKNTTALGLLSKEEQECLRIQNKLGHVQFYGMYGIWDNGKDWDLNVLGETFRIDPAWNPEPQPAERIREGFEVCEIQTLTDKNGRKFLGVVRNNEAIRLSTLIDLPDFVGGVFEGALNVICPHVKAFAHTEGLCFISSSADNKPITAKWAVFAR